MLFEEFMVSCVFLEKTHAPDGLGGYTTEYKDGAAFDAAIVKDTSLATALAQKDDVQEVYTITTRPGVGLDFHDAFKRVQDGQVFRVTSNSSDSRPPKSAGFDFEQVKAERWVLR